MNYMFEQNSPYLSWQQCTAWGRHRQGSIPVINNPRTHDDLFVPEEMFMHAPYFIVNICFY